MFYSSYAEQIQSHIVFLNSYGLDIPSLEFGRFIRCHEIGENQGRGRHVYICQVNQMKNRNLIGITTWCRGKSGAEGSWRTCGVALNNSITFSYQESSCKDISDNITEKYKDVARKAYGFWHNSSLSGVSDYLEKKEVGSYEIRFRSSAQYGNVAVVPMRDEKGSLWSYQLLNPCGQKRFPKEARTTGLFHILKPLIDGNPIGIAESYVTAATCYELSEISMVCCFSANNMASVAQSIKKLYPNSLLILCADNDRHLELQGKGNKGLLAALESSRIIGEGICVAEPDFVDFPASKEASDWNDLVRLRGGEFAKTLIQQKLRRENTR